MDLTHTTQFYSVIRLPEKYDTMTYEDHSAELDFHIKFKNGAVAFVPIYDGELLRGAKLPQIDVQGMTYSYQSSWTQRETQQTYRITLPLTGILAIHNNTDTLCEIQEYHTNTTTYF